MNWKDNIISFFLGIVIVIIFDYMFEGPTVVINNCNTNKSKYPINYNNKCYDLNLEQIQCPTIINTKNT